MNSVSDAQPSAAEARSAIRLVSVSTRISMRSRVVMAISTPFMLSYE
jgi:hypothetical protein